MVVGADIVSPTDFWNLRPWEVYWILEAKTHGTEPRRREEAHSRAYDLLKERRNKDGDAGPMSLADLRKIQAANKEGGRK